jgi:hypothetical protein
MNNTHASHLFFSTYVLVFIVFLVFVVILTLIFAIFGIFMAFDDTLPSSLMDSNVNMN